MSMMVMKQAKAANKKGAEKRLVFLCYFYAAIVLLADPE